MKTIKMLITIFLALFVVILPALASVTKTVATDGSGDYNCDGTHDE